MKFLKYAFFFTVLCIGICFCESVREGETQSFEAAGKYYYKQTGVILFEIRKDSVGYFALLANNGRKSTRDSFRLEEYSVLERNWPGFCGKTFDDWMSKHVIGGDDWRPHFNIGLYNSYNNFNFLSIKKGYTSKEHNFSSGYSMITGSECFIANVFRLNIDKVE